MTVKDVKEFMDYCDKAINENPILKYKILEIYHACINKIGNTFYSDEIAMAVERINQLIKK